MVVFFLPQLALNAMSLILLQQKRVHVKVPVDIPKEGDEGLQKCRLNFSETKEI